MSGVGVLPHRDLSSGELVDDDVPLAVGPLGELGSQDPTQVLATDEQIKAQMKYLLSNDPDLSNILPRIETLEDETDGLVNNADPLSYYILAKGT